MSSAPRRILLLLLLPIGDTLFATPTVRALRRAHPQAQIVALAYPSNAGILAANPDIDRLLLHPTARSWPGWRAYCGLLWRLNRRRFDLAVAFGPAQWWLVRAIHPRRWRRLAFPLWQWFLPLGARPWRHRHAVSSYATLLTAAERASLPSAPVLTCTQADRARAAELLAWAEGAPLLAFHPGGEGFRGMKRWPAARFAATARLLALRYGALVVVLGGSDEARLASGLAARVPGSRSLAGLLDLGQTVAVLERCALFVGNDSAPMHMAAAIGVPTVGIFGPTNPINFRPRGPRLRVVRSGLACSPCFHFVGSHPVWAGSRCRVPSCLHTVAASRIEEAAALLVGQDAEVAAHRQRA